jgi:hypothetical protein
LRDDTIVGLPALVAFTIPALLVIGNANCQLHHATGHDPDYRQAIMRSSEKRYSRLIAH